MTEGIEFNDLGTIDVTFDEKTYHLGRPKFRQWRHFSQAITDQTAAKRDRLTELTVRLAETANAIEEDADPTLRGVYQLAAEAMKTDASAVNIQVRDRAWADIMEAAPEDLKAEHDSATEGVKEFVATPFYLTSSELLQDIFRALGDPLPTDIDDWPAWLATDVSLPITILNHWKNHPKASGGAPPS